MELLPWQQLWKSKKGEGVQGRAASIHRSGTSSKSWTSGWFHVVPPHLHVHLQIQEGLHNWQGQRAAWRKGNNGNLQKIYSPSSGTYVPPPNYWVLFFTSASLNSRIWWKHSWFVSAHHHFRCSTIGNQLAVLPWSFSWCWVLSCSTSRATMHKWKQFIVPKNVPSIYTSTRRPLQ